MIFFPESRRINSKYPFVDMRWPLCWVDWLNGLCPFPPEIEGRDTPLHIIRCAALCILSPVVQSFRYAQLAAFQTNSNRNLIFDVLQRNDSCICLLTLVCEQVARITSLKCGSVDSRPNSTTCLFRLARLSTAIAHRLYIFRETPRPIRQEKHRSIEFCRAAWPKNNSIDWIRVHTAYICTISPRLYFQSTVIKSLSNHINRCIPPALSELQIKLCRQVSEERTLLLFVATYTTIARYTLLIQRSAPLHRRLILVICIVSIVLIKLPLLTRPPYHIQAQTTRIDDTKNHQPHAHTLCPSEYSSLRFPLNHPSYSIPFFRP